MKQILFVYMGILQGGGEILFKKKFYFRSQIEFQKFMSIDYSIK
jgi:hypothetical protein